MATKKELGIKDSLENQTGINPAPILGAIFFISFLVWGIFQLANNAPASSTTTFYTSELSNVRSCASITCNVIGQYPKNTKFDVNYTEGTLPDWVPVNWADINGNIQQGYISKTVLIDQSRIIATTNAPAPVTIQQPSKATDLPSIIKEWSPRVVRIVCSDINYISTGSGVLTRMDWSNIGKSSDAPTLVTNKHVVTDPDTTYPYTACNFAVPGLSQTYSMSMTGEQVIANQDVAYFPSGTKNPPPGAQTSMNVCKPSHVSVGDKIIILGYPGNGGTGTASTAITATDGIISSYDGEYYVTDAKIDHGNSGGAAILLKDDCYLGIPTWAQSGGFESFGRILSSQYFLK